MKGLLWFESAILGGLLVKIAFCFEFGEGLFGFTLSAWLDSGVETIRCLPYEISEGFMSAFSNKRFLTITKRQGVQKSEIEIA
jgi:hypothetical protein